MIEITSTNTAISSEMLDRVTATTTLIATTGLGRIALNPATPAAAAEGSPAYFGDVNLYLTVSGLPAFGIAWIRSSPVNEWSVGIP
jgi:hypothetical protein